MSKNKDQDFKEFQISTRKKIGPGMTNAPVWILRKAGKRIWNPKQKRHWKNVDIGYLYRKKEKKKKAAKRRKTSPKRTGAKKKQQTGKKTKK